MNTHFSSTTAAPAIAEPLVDNWSYDPAPTVVNGSRPHVSAYGPLQAFLLGLGTRLQLNLVGYLPFSELALILLFPLTFPRAFSSANLRKTGWIVPLCFLWLASAIVTDLYRGTQWSLAARGIARAFIFCVAIPQIVQFFSSDGYRKAVWFTLGTIPSIILSQYIFRGGVHEGRERVYGKAMFDFETHWSMVLGAVILLAAMIIYRRSRLLAHVVSWITGVFQIAGGSRSSGMFFLIGSALCMVKRRTGGPLITRDVLASLMRVTFAVAVLTGVGYGIYSLYSDAAASGRLGERAQEKYLEQSSSRLGLLLGGREEFVAGTIAALQSPIIGYGSWPLDRDGFYLQACELSGRPPNQSYYKLGYPLIPTHSHIMCAWVENGIGGLLFWGYLIAFYIRQILRPVADEKRLGLYFALSVISLVWHILFSPMAGRVEQTVVIALVANDAFALTLDSSRHRMQALRKAA